MTGPWVALLLLWSAVAPAAERWTLANGAPLVARQDPRLARETVILQFNAGGGGSGPGRPGGAAMARAVVALGLQDQRWRFLHLSAGAWVEGDARASWVGVVAPEDTLAQALALAVDAVRHPVLDAPRRAAAAALVAERARDRFRDASDALWFAVHRQVEGEGSDLQEGDATGAEADAISLQDLQALLPAVFDPGRLAYAASGPAEPETVLRWIEAEAQRGGTAIPYADGWKAPVPGVRPRGVLVRILPRPDASVVAFCVLVSAQAPPTAKQQVVVRLAQQWLGGDGDSRLQLALKTKTAWSSDIHSFAHASEWGFTGRVEPGSLAGVLKALPLCIADLTELPPDADEFRLQKAKVETSFLNGDGDAGVWVARQLLDQRWYRQQDGEGDRRQALDSVTEEDVLEYARTLTLANAVLGLAGDPGPLKDVVRNLPWDVTEERYLSDPEL